jgi:hypothetical protein
VLEPVGRVGDLPGQRLVVEALQDPRYGDGPRPRVPGQVGQLLPPVRGERQDGDHPQSQAGEHQDDELPPVRQLDEDPVVGAQA